MANQYKKQLDNLMQHEVSRGEFLKLVGVTLLGFVGVVGFLKNLHQAVPAQAAAKHAPATSGYGRSVYGR